MKYTHIILLFFTLVIAGCSDNNDEPKTEKNKLIGYWAVTHIQTIEHIGGNHSTTDKDVPPHALEGSPDGNNYRYDVLIFDEDFVTVRGDMPNKPKGSDFDLDTTEGQIEYNESLDKWYNSIGQMTDQLTCPVGKYSIKDGNLIIGTLNMGILSFISGNEFTLDYKKSLNKPDDYSRSIYTFSRIYSLTL